jgi:hypothetical protein
VSKLRRRSIAALKHPGRLSELGEALALVPEHQDEARRILEHLAASDLLTSAHAYAALAKLRAAAGDDEGRDRAFTRCRELTKLRSVCGADAGA